MMKRIAKIIFSLQIALLVCACSTGNDADRARDPWVFRINLDNRPRMIGLALNKNLWAAYDAPRGALYKAWRGDVKFTGPVYDNIHVVQPYSRGEAYIVDSLAISPWSVRKNGETVSIMPEYQGYFLKDGQVTLRYSLPLSKDAKINIEETPEYVAGEDGRPGFERVFKTADVPPDVSILLAVSFKHLRNENDVETNGELVDETFSANVYEWGKSISGRGQLKLNANGATHIRSFFEPQATAHVVTEPTEDMAEESAEGEGGGESASAASDDPAVLAARGKNVIGSSDCAACHAIDKPVIGPSYTMIARKYENTPEVIEQLSGKIINGGSGVWGTRAMSPHPLVSKEDALAMAAYILSVVPDSDMKPEPGVAVDFYEIGQPLASLPEVVAGQSPNASRAFPVIDFRSGNPDIGEDTDENFLGFKNDFVMQVNGYLNVPETATYELQFVANNGGRLAIDGKTVLSGHYYEGTYFGEKTLHLTKGAHPLKIDFYHHLFDKYLVLMWRRDKNQEFEVIPASAYTHNPYDVKPSSPGIKEIYRSNAPGFGASLEDVHPSFDLSPVRPEGFEPRVGDLSFMDDGRLVLCTWDGEVYEMKNVTSGDPADVKIAKIADGLSEPLGITGVDGEIYVLQRWELTRLVDNDGDGITDEYRSIADDWKTTADFHEWSFGLIYRDGYFYGTLGIAQGYFYEEQVEDRGKAIKIAMDGTYTFLAHGLREANGIGFGLDGELFTTDNEGSYVPVCKVIHIPEEGYPFFGNRDIIGDSLPDLPEKPPVIWLPQNEIGNSPTQPIMLHHGPYEGQMIHGEITHGGIKRNFIEKVNGQYQGAVFRFSQGLEVGINRLEWGPDKALYAAGLGGAQDFGHKGHQYGLQRLTYNGNPAFEMLAIRARSNGIEIEFTKPLRVGDGTDPADYRLQQWYYTWAGEGNSQQKRDLENLNVRSVSLSSDRKKVFLELRGMKAAHVIYVQLQAPFLSENNEQLWSNEGWYTLNLIPDEKEKVNPYPFPSKDNSLSPDEKAQGWELLFDGKSLADWQTSGKEAGAGWAISKGEISGKGPDALLMTAREFDNYELELEWRLDSGAEGGILIHTPADADLKKALAVAPRMQIIDQHHETAKTIKTQQSGANYDVQAPKHRVSKPIGEYNHTRLVVHDGHVEHWINGIKAIEYQLGSEAWKRSLAGTIYENQPEYGKARSGHIVLLNIGGKICFKNIRIRQL